MPDPTSIITIAAAAGYFRPTLNAFLTNIFGPISEELGEAIANPVRTWRMRNADAAFQGAKEDLERAAIEPQPVKPSLLIPLLEAASLEDDTSLTALWSALLANAAAGSSGSRVHPRYVSILQQITAEDAVILDYLGTWDSLAPSSIEQKLLDTLHLDKSNLHSGLDALISLGLAQRVSFNYMDKTRTMTFASPGEEPICISPFGRAFLSAVSAPRRAS